MLMMSGKKNPLSEKPEQSHYAFINFFFFMQTPNLDHSGPQHAIFLLYQEINLNIILGGRGGWGGVEFCVLIIFLPVGGSASVHPATPGSF